MKKTLLLGALLGLVIVTAGCNWRPWLKKGAATSGPDVPPTTTYIVNPASSTLKWSLKNVRGFSGTGEAKIASGNFVADDTGVTSGKIAIDTASLIKNGGNTLAADHFKLDTYLNAAKLFSATLTIGEVRNVDVRAETATQFEVEGKLSVGPVTKTFIFPMTFVRKGNMLTADGVIATNASEQAARTEVPVEITNFLKGTNGSGQIMLHLEARAQ